MLVFTLVVQFRSKEQSQTLMCYSGSYPPTTPFKYSPPMLVLLDNGIQDLLSRHKFCLLRENKDHLAFIYVMTCEIGCESCYKHGCIMMEFILTVIAMYLSIS